MTVDLEYEAKTLNKAIAKAAEALNVSADQLDFDIISHGSSGLFGLSRSKNAKIRVSPPGKNLDAASLVDRLDQELSGGAPTEVDPVPAAGLSVEVAQILNREDSKELGLKVLKRIVDSISDDARISTQFDSDGLVFSIEGSDAALLIGKRGQTLEAIQSLVEKIINKQNGNNGKIHVQVDVEGYLQTRQENLEKLAQKLAAKSKRIGKPIALSQMSAYERRIVHLALKRDPSVRTKSRGEGFRRKLVIFPRKNHSN